MDNKEMNLENLDLWYLASPYTATDKKVLKQRGVIAVQSAAALIKQDIHVFSPIAYNCGWEKYKVPSKWSFWEKFDLLFLSKCRGVIVLKIPGWKASVGVTAELAYAAKHKMPIIYITLGDIKNNRVSAKIKDAMRSRLRGSGAALEAIRAIKG